MMSDLLKVELKCGVIYIEPFVESLREEVDRIKIFDTNEKYLDYLLAECIENVNDYDDVIESIKECCTVTELLRSIGCDWRLISPNWRTIAEKLGLKTKRAVLDNEWVNKVGNQYIVIK